MWRTGNRSIELGLGLWQQYPYHRLVDLATQAEDAGYDVLWCGNEKFYRDMWVMAGLVAAHIKHARIGTFIAEPYSYHPAMIAAAIATLDEATNGRAILLLGAGGVGFREMGITRDRPVRAVEDAIRIIRTMLRGESATLEDSVIEAHGARLAFEARADLPLWVASRGNAMLRMAARAADGIMIATYATPPGIRAALDQIAAVSGQRHAGKELALTVRVDVALDDDPAAARAAVKPMIAGMIKASYPNADFVRQAGLELSPDLHETLAQLDFAELDRAVAFLPEEFVDAFAWAGTPVQVAEKVAAVVKMGISRITFLPHATPDCPTEAVVARFATDVMPRVVALLGG